jgi:adenosylmethionine-8-amino-7-oxononanoate aminotransferase
MTLKASDRQFLGRGFETEDLEIVSTDSGLLRDAQGRRYLDWLSGWCVGNFGWGAEHLREAIRTYRGPDYVAPRFRYAPWVELARLLARLAPGKLRVAWRATGGTEAVDIALQIAMAVTGRAKFVAIRGAYHGNSIGAVSIGEDEAREALPNRLRGCETLAPPLDARAVARAERLLRRRDVAAVIMEPVVMNLAVEIPTPEFMKRLAAACKRTGTLLIMDEVACGFGRTGKLFASEHYRIAPDMMCLAKAITGGYAPLGATLTTPAIARKLGEKAAFYSTYGWHPLATAVALANLKWIVANQRALLRQVDQTAKYLRQRLARLPFKALRMKGLAIAAETDSPAQAGRIAARCKDKSLLIGAEDRYLMLYPPLTVDPAPAKFGMDILERAVWRA